MSKKTPTSLLMQHVLPRVDSLARAALHFCVLLLMSVFPCAAPGFGLLNVVESEAPADQDESSQEEAVNGHARTRVGRVEAGWPLLVSVRGALRLATENIATISQSGHRLSHDLLAPLRC